MWLRGAAIRPIPTYAVIDRSILDGIERELALDEDPRAPRMSDAFARFEATQPLVAEQVSRVLGRPLDETALALGYFLTVSVWLAFDRMFGARLLPVNVDAWHAAEAALRLEEDLRAQHGDEPIEYDDIVCSLQPGVMQFVHEHVDAALDVLSRSEADGTIDVDVDDVHAVYRFLLTEVVALSHAVALGERANASGELLA